MSTILSGYGLSGALVTTGVGKREPRPIPTETIFQRWNVCSKISSRRLGSATGVPVSTCFYAKGICSCVYPDFSISGSFAEGFTKPGNYRLEWIEKTGDVTDYEVPFAP